MPGAALARSLPLARAGLPGLSLWADRARLGARGGSVGDRPQQERIFSLGPVSLACLFGPTVPVLGHAVARSETGHSRWRGSFSGQLLMPGAAPRPLRVKMSC
jgi:hypothetical protein